jgi:hypothetical protein
MSLSSPLITIIIPTRDRPEYASLVLRSVLEQTFQDVEVIVSDNALHQWFEPDPRIFDGKRVRYIRPSKPVWMTDHYEFAVSQAVGRYVGVLGDKSLLVKQALAQVAAEIQKDGSDAVSWRTGFFQPSRQELAGPGIVTVKRAATPDISKLSGAEALDYLLATYLEPNFEPDHQLETRGSIYHGVFSRDLIAATKARFGRLFHHYAPDLNAQCVAMQVAKAVTHINRPLELIMAGPSNGRAVTLTVTKLLRTQEEAAQGASGASLPLIPGVSASIYHLLASDLVALSGRELRPDQWVELYRKVAYDLHLIGGWPDRAMKQSQFRALENGLARAGTQPHDLVVREKWKARRTKARVLLGDGVRSRFGTGIDRLRRIVGRRDGLEKRSCDHLFQALVGHEL